MCVPTVLVACVHNAGRSQAAAALLRYYAGDRLVVLSGGSQPTDEVNPVVATVLAERGLQLTDPPRRWDVAMVRSADVVVTMGCGDTCPFYPGKRYEDWDVVDPAGRMPDQVRPIVDDIDRRVRQLLVELLPDLSLPPSPGAGG
ncbi:MAG: arsenate-mycothiol transferase ArsC [Actinomycetes bacterium]